MTTRRELLIALGASAFSVPLSSIAQQQNKVWRVGVLSLRRVDFVDSDYLYGPFRRGMRELGYVEGKNLLIEWRSAEGDNARLPGLAAELVSLKVDVIVASASVVVSAAQRATLTIPIVMGNTADPVELGQVKSLARPGGNITGLASMAGEVRLKQLQILLDLMPKLSLLAILLNPSNVSHISTAKMLETAARKRGLAILRGDASTPQEIDRAFSEIRRQDAGAMMVFNDPFFQQRKDQIAELATRHRLPAVAGDRVYAEAGLLMSYGASIADQHRRAATYVDKIFKGAKPADLPVEQPTVFDLVINGKTAKALGLTIPQALMISANKVIE